MGVFFLSGNVQELCLFWVECNLLPSAPECNIFQNHIYPAHSGLAVFSVAGEAQSAVISVYLCLRDQLQYVTELDIPQMGLKDITLRPANINRVLGR